MKFLVLYAMIILWGGGTAQAQERQLICQVAYDHDNVDGSSFSGRFELFGKVASTSVPIVLQIDQPIQLGLGSGWLTVSYLDYPINESDRGYIALSSIKNSEFNNVLMMEGAVGDQFRTAGSGTAINPFLKRVSISCAVTKKQN